MTTAALARFADYLENGATTAWPVPFRFILPSDIRAQRKSASGDIVLLTYGVDYTVAGGATDAGGTLTTTAPAAVGTTLNIWSATARGQTADYETGDTFPAETHELRLDTLDLIAQEQDADLARTISVPRGEAGTVLPAAAARANRFLAFDAAGNPAMVTGTTSADVAVQAAEAARDEALFARDEAAAAAAVFAAGQAIRAEAAAGVRFGYHVRPTSTTSHASTAALEWAKGFDGGTVDDDTSVRIGREISFVTTSCKIPATAAYFRARVFSRATTENGLPEGAYDTMIADTGPVPLAEAGMEYSASYTGYGIYGLPLPAPFKVEASKSYVLAFEFQDAGHSRVAASVAYKTITDVAQRLEGYLDTGAGWASYTNGRAICVGCSDAGAVNVTDAVEAALATTNPVAAASAPSLLRPIEMLFLEREPWRLWRYPGVTTTTSAVTGHQGLANALGKPAWSPGFMMGEDGVTFGCLSPTADLTDLSTDPNYVSATTRVLLQSSYTSTALGGGFLYENFKLLGAYFDIGVNGAPVTLRNGLIDANGVNVTFGISQQPSLTAPGLLTLENVTLRGHRNANAVLTNAHAINCHFDFTTADNINGGTNGLTTRKLWLDGCLLQRPGATSHPFADAAAHSDNIGLASVSNTRIVGCTLYYTSNASSYSAGVIGETSSIGLGSIATPADGFWMLGSIIGGGSYNCYFGFSHTNAAANNWMIINNLFLAGGGLAPSNTFYSRYGEFYLNDFVAGAEMSNMFFFGNVAADGYPVRLTGSRLPVAANVPALLHGAAISIAVVGSDSGKPIYQWTPGAGTTLCGMFNYDADTLGDAEMEMIDRLGRNHGIEIINPLTRALNPLYDFGSWVNE